MAYIVDYVNTESTAGAASFTCGVPPHVADDVLVAIMTQDATGTLSMAGWTQIGTTQTANTAVTSAAFYKKAASSSETAVVTMGTADAIAVTVLCLRDVDTSVQLDASSTTNSGASASSTVTSVSISTTTSDCLILYAVGKDGIANEVMTDPGVHFIVSSDSGGSTATTAAAQGIGWYIQRTAGSTPAPTWVSKLSAVSTFFTMAFRNKSGGIVPAYVDDSIVCGTRMITGHHFSTLNNLTFDASLSLANIGPAGTGKATVFDAAAEIADFGTNPYSSALSHTPATQAATGAAGFQVTFTTTHDLSTDFLVGTVIASTPKMANYNHGSVTEGGSFIAVADASNNYHSFQVLAKDSKPNTEGRAVFSIQPNQTSTRYGYSSSAPTLSATKKILFLSNNPTATITLYVAEIHRARTHVVAGGVSAQPVDADGLVVIGKSFRVPLIQKSGATGILSLVPLQFGGGDAVNLKLTAGSLQFPRIYNTTTKEINFHAVSANIGLSLYGKTGDSIYMGDGYVVSSPSNAYFNIHPSATSGATWYFGGLTISGMAIVLRNVTTFDSILFTGNSIINITGCTLTSCNIINVPSTSDSLITSSTTVIGSSTINTTSVGAGNYLCSVANPTIFNNTIFTGSASTGHAIRITTAGTYNIIGLIFNGYGATGTTSAAIYNDSGGLVTLNVNGGNTPTFRNGTNATTVVNNTITLSITNIISGSDIVIYQAGTTTVLSNTQENVGTTLNYVYSTSGISIDIGVFISGYVPYYVRGYVLPSTNATLPVSQIIDRAYLV